MVLRKSFAAHTLMKISSSFEEASGKRETEEEEEGERGNRIFHASILICRKENAELGESVRFTSRAGNVHIIYYSFENREPNNF